jgi:hypothetical protein
MVCHPPFLNGSPYVSHPPDISSRIPATRTPRPDAKPRDPFIRSHIR